MPATQPTEWAARPARASAWHLFAPTQPVTSPRRQLALCKRTRCTPEPADWNFLLHRGVVCRSCVQAA